MPPHRFSLVFPNRKVLFHNFINFHLYYIMTRVLFAMFCSTLWNLLMLCDILYVSSLVRLHYKILFAMPLTKHFHIHCFSTIMPCKHLRLPHAEVGIGRAATNHPALDPQIDLRCILLTPKNKQTNKQLCSWLFKYWELYRSMATLVNTK